LRHLIHSNEMLGMQMASLHNLTFYLELVRMARKKIEDGVFAVWKNQMIENISRRL